jgi:uncharacterized protein (TIGR03437 family)
MGQRFCLLSILALPMFASTPASFAFPTQRALGAGCYVAARGDFNGDGKPDLVVACSGPALHLLLGNGNGTFTRKDIAIDFLGGAAVQDFFVADFNGDGKLDLCASINGPGLLLRGILLIGNGDGTFQEMTLDESVGAVGDFNQDGKPDLLTIGPSSYGYPDSFGIRLGKGDGTFSPVVMRFPFVDGIPGGFVTGDFNGDGKLDVVQVYHRSSGRVQMWLGNGDGTFQESHPVGGFGGGLEIAAIDLNGDHLSDLVVASQSYNGGVNVLFGKPDGTFRAVKLPLGDPASYFFPVAQGISFADFNGDGLLDIAVGTTIYLADGQGGFENPVSLGPLAEVTYSFVMDFNSDGKPDLIAGSSISGDLVVFLDLRSTLTSSLAVNAASTGNPSVAPASVASGYGVDLAPTTATSSGPDYPTSLGGVRVHVVDARGVDHLAPILYVSPTQINFQISPNVALGYAIVNVENPASSRPAGARAAPIGLGGPVLYTVDDSVNGTAAATAVRVQADGTQTSVPVFQCSMGAGCTSVPIDLAAKGTVYLSLYGAYFSAWNYPPTTSCSIGGQTVIPRYVGPQDPSAYNVYSQVNLLLPPTLPPGKVGISCVLLAQGFLSNQVTISVK